MCAPDVPSAQETASAQTGTNVSTAIANAMLGNVNQVTPYGSLNYDRTGNYRWTDPSTGSVYNIPTFTATQSLTPQGQAIQDSVIGAQTNLAQTAETASGRLNDMLGTGINLGNAPDAGQSGGIRAQVNTPNLQTFNRTANLAGAQRRAGDVTRTYGADFSADRQRVEDAIMSRAQPGLEADRKALEARLADQGIELGSAAYQSAMDDYGRNVNDMRTSAILAGGQEQSRLTGLEASRAAFENSAQAQSYGQNTATAQGQLDNLFRNNQANNATRETNFQNRLAAAGFNNDARQQRFDMANTERNQYLQEQYANRNQGLNELLSLMSGSQVQNPNFVNTSMPQIAGTDYQGAVQNEYAGRMANWSNMLGGIGGLLALSDRRAKTDISEVGKTGDGQKIYAYRYKHEGEDGPIHMGLMAQEVEKKKPEAVKTGPDGLKRVNYGIALGV